MKKGHKRTTGKRTVREYDFRGGVRGKYAARYAKGSNVVVVPPDIAKVFPDSASVSRALRACMEMMEKLPHGVAASKR